MKKAFHLVIYVFAVIGFFLVMGYFAVKTGLTNVPGVIDHQRDSFLGAASQTWIQGEEWQVFKKAVSKDASDINRAASIVGIPARLIVTNLAAEQLRLFYSEREIFKTAFAPLKILGNQSQFSWGVMGLKQDTARAIEEHLVDRSSPYYLGEAFEHALDFTTTDHDRERFQRITDDKSRYYSYLYTALYLKQIMHQWQIAGYDISNRPEIVSTLFNIGFIHSEPKQYPQTGGAELVIAGQKYSFGGFAAAFYHSDELTSEFKK